MYNKYKKIFILCGIQNLFINVYNTVKFPIIKCYVHVLIIIIIQFGNKIEA